jgi:hypothetical protein
MLRSPTSIASLESEYNPLFQSKMGVVFHVRGSTGAHTLSGDTPIGGISKRMS